MSIKVDVAVQSYKKPELLIYTLLSLKKYSGDHIDTVYINDDGSTNEQKNIYSNSDFLKLMYPLKVKFRSNIQRMGWWYSPIKGLDPKYKKDLRFFYKILKYYFKSRALKSNRSDCRYQWAIDSTDKKYIYIIHDDMEFFSDIIGLYLEVACSNNKIGAVGDLGQCWRCNYALSGCNPEKILSGFRPDINWPDDPKSIKNRWPCRLNEWSVLVSKDVTNLIEFRDGILFGNYDNNGDVGAFWFSRLIEYGFQFDDPLSNINSRRKYYLHADGKSGHAAWVDQGNGIIKYDGNRVSSLIKNKFGLNLKK